MISGGTKLQGTMRVHGAKNSVLPILAATILNGGKSTLHDCPRISDVLIAIQILEFLGCRVDWQGDTLCVDSTQLTNDSIPHDLMNKMRSSVIFLGAILARNKEAKCSYPGGCELGARPINLHIKAFRQMGTQVKEEGGYIYCKAGRMPNCRLQLDFPSVGATENIMLAACLGNHTVTIVNAAREPEIADLQDFLNKMGAKIRGAGGSVIVIEGVNQLHDVEKTIMPDRIVAESLLFATAATGGDVTLTNVQLSHITSGISLLEEMGATITTKEDRVRIKAGGPLRAIDTVQTLPYPGFPTDAQPLLMAALTVAKGTSIIKETIFENRFKAAAELQKMGADITINERIAVIRGVDSLTGASVRAPDLRGGAALVVGAMCAQGVSVIDGIGFIERGYERLDQRLNQLGAKIQRVE